MKNPKNLSETSGTTPMNDMTKETKAPSTGFSRAQRRPPKQHKVGGVTVSVFDESTPGKPKHRVRWYVGKKREAETFDSQEAADVFAMKKATDLNNADRPPTNQELAELRRKAILY